MHIESVQVLEVKLHEFAGNPLVMTDQFQLWTLLKYV